MAATWALPAEKASASCGMWLPVLSGARLCHEQAVVDMAFSPEGDRVATAGRDGTARLWELNTGLEIARAFIESEVAFLGFSPDGTRWAAMARDSSAPVWEAAGGRKPGALLSAGGEVGLLFNRSGHYLGPVSKRRGRDHFGEHCLVLAQDTTYAATSPDRELAWVWETASSNEDASSDLPSASLVERLGTLSWPATKPVSEKQTDSEIARFVDHAQWSRGGSAEPRSSIRRHHRRRIPLFWQAPDRSVRSARVWAMQGGARLQI
jgi:WD40 repeat protein